MKFPFICVNYNTYEETIKYINNIREIDIGNDAVVIIVDNSPDESNFNKLSDYLKEENRNYDNVYLLRRKNNGYFQGLNDGILFAKKLNITDTFFVVGNNDIIFESNFIEEIKSLLLNENVLVVAPDVVTNEGSHENPHVIDKMSALRKIKYDIYFSHYFVAKFLDFFRGSDRPFKPFDSESKEIHMGIGALYVLTPNFFKHFDKLDEDVFLYGEEAILSGQIKSVGGKIMYLPQLRCRHNESSTTSKMDRFEKFRIIQESYKKYKKYL